MDGITEAPAATLPRIKFPKLDPVTPEEIERRRAVVRRIREVRDEIGTIGVRVEDLIHELRGGDDRFDK